MFCTTKLHFQRTRLAKILFPDANADTQGYIATLSCQTTIYCGFCCINGDCELSSHWNMITHCDFVKTQYNCFVAHKETIRNGFLKVGTQLLVFNHVKHVLLAQIAGEDNWYKSDQPACQYYLCMNWHRLAKLMLKFQCFTKIGSFVIKLLHSSSRKTSEDQKPRNRSWINVCRSWTNHI